ncbi:MAG: hypothetical protein JRF39_08730 [Deltaproteobacteria bacterium]|nr:hypothetical protein [Deltaproteobacteria bacterium]
MADGQGEAAWGTSGQVSLHGKAHPLNTYNFLLFTEPSTSNNEKIEIE